MIKNIHIKNIIANVFEWFSKKEIIKISLF